MKKDVIYIDTEDEITSIIGKVKAADAKIVALVPPKRVGVLQSVVNLKLLQKAAGGVDKRVVLITNDPSLTALAAGVKIPVAKNLQSRPEIASIAALDVDHDDIINGEDLPVGDIAATVGVGAVAESVQLPASPASPVTTPNKIDLKSVNKTPKKGQSIPNFETFRKKLFIIGGAVILLIIFLIWAIAFAPKATITISAKTNAVNVARDLTLDPGVAKSDPATLIMKPNVQQLKKAVSVDFDATGSKDIGSKASGSITIRNCDYPDGFTLPADTRFTAENGKVFVSNQSVTIPKFTGPASTCKTSGSGAGKGTVAVQASALGAEYNIPAQEYSFGASSADVDAVGSAMSGGTKETVTVVSAADVEKAKQQLAQQDVSSAKSELFKLFGPGYRIIGESFVSTQGSPAVTPDVDEQAKRAKLTLETTFTQAALADGDVKAVLDTYMKEQLVNKPDQSIYSNGENNLVFAQFQQQGAKSLVKLNATGYIGAKIDTGELAKQLQGKRYGEIEQIVNKIPGVNKVDIKFSPFWVNSAPSPEKTEIKFSVLNDAK